MPPEYVTKGEYEKLRDEHKEEMFKLRKQIQEQRAREEEREKLVSRLWMERVVYISIIVAAVSILITIIVT